MRNNRWKCILLLLGIAPFFHVEIFAEPRDEIQVDDLIYMEKIILEFYQDGSSRERAVRDLDFRCRWKDQSSGLSCANLAILYKNLGDLPKAYTAAALAYQKEPRDNYYRNLFQNLAMESNNLKDMERRMGAEGKLVARYSRVIQACQSGLPRMAESDMRILVSSREIRREALEKGLFWECFRNDGNLYKELIGLSSPNGVVYSRILREAEDSFHPYRDLWDLDFYRKENSKKQNDSEKSPRELTELWRELKIALQSKNKLLAQRKYDEFQKRLDALGKSGGKQKILAGSLQLAARLLAEQDPRFLSLDP